LPKAFSLYLEYLGKSLLSPHFFQEFHRKSSSPHLSATRQIENLICTNRESLLGSSAWRPDFLKELQSRPFFMHKRSTASQYFYDCGSCGGNEGWNEERCQACGRTSQKPDHQVILFGPSYIATKSWESHWREVIPKVVLLNPTNSDDREKKTFSSSSAVNTPKKDKNTTKPSSGTTTKSSSGKKNKQFKAFQKETAALPSVSEGAKRRLSLTPKDKKNEGKKKNSIILSDSEEEEENDKEKEKEKENNQKKSGEKKNLAIDLTEDQEAGGNNENDHLLWMKEEKKPISNKMIFGADEDDEEEEENNIHDLIDAVHDSSSSGSSDTSSSSSEGEEDENDEENRRNFRRNAANKSGKKKLQWWEKRLPRELNAENESKWQLSL
jgi:hypothetical protein